MNYEAEVVRFRLGIVVHELRAVVSEVTTLRTFVAGLGKDWVEVGAYLGNVLDDLEEALEELGWLYRSMRERGEAR